MAENKRYTFKKILLASVWIMLSVGLIVLLVAAITRKNNEAITGMEINISGVQNTYFINKADVVKILESVHGKKLEKADINSLDLSAMEKGLEKNQWIKKAEIFIDNNNVLQINIDEREPIARIFTTTGASFYIDSSLMRLPLSDKFSVRLPLFTSFPTDVIVLTKQDSSLLKEIKVMSEYVGSDSFWMAQIEQIDITPEGTFELIPKLGNQIIRFGNTEDYQEKFNNLLAFYQQVQTRTGWNRYSVLDLRYSGQVVAVNRDQKEIKADSLLVIQIMKNIIADAQKKTNDSTNIQLTQSAENNNIDHSRAIEDVPDENVAGNKVPAEDIKANNGMHYDAVQKPVVKNVIPGDVKQPAKPVAKPPIETTKKPAMKKREPKKETIKKVEKKNDEVPKAVMPSKSDY